MRLLLRSGAANVFLSFYKLKWLEQCPSEFKLVFYKEMLVILLFSLNHNMSFSFEQEKDGRLPMF